MRLEPVSGPPLLWLTRRAGSLLSPSAVGMAAVDSSGRVHGMVAYDGFTPNSCVMHIAVDSMAAMRPLARAAFVYPFETLGLGVVFAGIRGNNARSLRLAKSAGFRVLSRSKDGYAKGDDLVVLELRPEDCRRWLTPSVLPKHTETETRVEV